MRPALNTAIFRDVAFRMSASSTRSGTIAICAGIFRPWIVPSVNAIA